VFKNINVVFLSAFLLLICQTSLGASSDKLQMSSAIPDKREFPLSQSINACDDFHSYVCSDVEKSFKLRDDRSSHTFAFSDSDERILEKKKNFFKNIKNEKKLSPRSLQFKDFYMACMNSKESAKEERALVKKLASEVKSIKTIEDYIKINVANMTNEKWGFISYEIMPNIDNPLIYDMTFDLGYMGLPEQSYYENAELVTAYTNLIAESLNTIFPKESKAEHLKRAQAVVDFEKKFIKDYPLPDEFRKRWTQPRKVSREDFLKQTSAIGLEPFFSKNVPETTQLRDFMPESFAFVQNELNATNLPVLRDMYAYRSGRSYMDDAYPEYFKKRWDFRHKFFGGPLSRADRQERCTESVMGSFSREFDLEMLPRLFPNFPREKMNLVAESIRSSILKGIEKNSWLTSKSRKGAIEKIKTAKLQLVQPMTDREWDFKEIQKYNSRKPYENAKTLAMASHERSFKELREGVNQEAWGMGPLTVNAYYSPDKNKFVLPIGILQYPFFISDGELIENLGAVGMIVGHELGHSIDDEGSKFDSAGRLNQWMSDEDINKFKERGAKMVDQFNKIGHNGSLTLGENVADLVGLTFAYNAAFPGNKGTLTDKQKFFVAYGRLWCNVTREKAKEMQLKTDPHSLGWARINEQVKHQPGFYEAFSCTDKNKLYLSEKDRVQIW
jgi:putative endopeptidase